jgi:hypothetical protein
MQMSSRFVAARVCRSDLFSFINMLTHRQSINWPRMSVAGYSTVVTLHKNLISAEIICVDRRYRSTVRAIYVTARWVANVYSIMRARGTRLAKRRSDDLIVRRPRSESKRIPKAHRTVLHITVEIYSSIETRGVFANKPLEGRRVVAGPVEVNAGATILSTGSTTMYTETAASESQFYLDQLVTE